MCITHSLHIDLRQYTLVVCHNLSHSFWNIHGCDQGRKTAYKFYFICLGLEVREVENERDIAELVGELSMFDIAVEKVMAERSESTSRE